VARSCRSVVRCVFKNIVHTLNHVYVIDLIFQAHLEGREHGFTARNTPDHPPLDELRREQRALDDWYIAWSDRVTESELERKVHFMFVGGGEGTMTCAEIALHLANHTTYHRGPIGRLIYVRFLVVMNATTPEKSIQLA
jgi:uncharacterized damage-inducible protein DinB